MARLPRALPPVPIPGPYAHPPAPTPVPLIGTLDQRLGALAEAISRKPDATLEPTYAALLMMAPDGSTWRVTMTATGSLQTSKVTR